MYSPRYTRRILNPPNEQKSKCNVLLVLMIKVALAPNHPCQERRGSVSTARDTRMALCLLLQAVPRSMPQVVCHSSESAYEAMTSQRVYARLVSLLLPFLAMTGRERIHDQVVQSYQGSDHLRASARPRLSAAQVPRNACRSECETCIEGIVRRSRP